LTALKNAADLNFESLLNKVLKKHTHEILTIFQHQLQLPRGQQLGVFSGPGIVSLTRDGKYPSSNSDTSLLMRLR
jgi:hypothetical protein